MRVLTIVGVALGGAATVLSAQHAHQVEIGVFGTFDHFDSFWGLNNGAGYGGRLAYSLSDDFGLEVAGDFASPTPTAGGPGVSIFNKSASLVLNSGGEHNILYVLGGYSEVHLGSPYDGGVNAAHGAIGDRVFFTSRVALRLEAGVFYSPSQAGIPTSLLNFQGSAGLSLVLGGSGGGEETPKMSKEKRDSIIAAGGTVPTAPPQETFVERGLTWPHQWFWGAEAGLMVFNDGVDGVSAEPTFGGHWLITANRTAMYVGYDQAFFLSDRHATIPEPSGTIEPGNISFNTMRRIMVGMLAFPTQKAIQPFAGAGFALVEILNPVATCTGCSSADLATVQDSALDEATRAFFWWMGGIDIRQGRLTLYGHYIIMTNSSNFLLTGVIHTLEAGLRYSLGGSREDDPSER